MLGYCGVGEDSWESLGLQGDPTSPFWRRSVLGFLWREWCWSWNSSTSATSCEELTHWKRLWCWEGLRAGGEGDDREWDGWMAELTQWTWVWVNSGSWWWTGRPGVLRFHGVAKSWTQLRDWTELNWWSCQGFPGGTSGKEPTCQCRRQKRVELVPWLRKIPWRRAWQPTLVFLPKELHRQRSLGATVHRVAKSWTEVA